MKTFEDWYTETQPEHPYCQKHLENAWHDGYEQNKADADRWRWLLTTNLGVFMQLGGKLMAGLDKDEIDKIVDKTMLENA
jgi:hypothetical protein